MDFDELDEVVGIEMVGVREFGIEYLEQAAPKGIRFSNRSILHQAKYVPAGNPEPVAA